MRRQPELAGFGLEIELLEETRPHLRDVLLAVLAEVGAVRVDDRRWDLRLKDGTLIQLPAIDEEAALIRLDGLEQSQRILDLGLARIDLRNSEFLAVRPRDAVQSAGGV